MMPYPVVAMHQVMADVPLYLLKLHIAEGIHSVFKLRNAGALKRTSTFEHLISASKALKCAGCIRAAIP